MSRNLTRHLTRHLLRHPTRAALPFLLAASLVLGACGADPSPEATGTSPRAASSSASGGSSDAPSPDWTSLAHALDGTPLMPGSYGLTPNGGSGRVVVVVRAPGGYQNFGGWTFVTDPPFHAMGVVTATRVPPDPCGSEGHDKLEAAVDPGPSVRDLATALIAQKGTATSKPVPVRLDGHRGLYLTYRVAKGVDVRKCEASAFDILTTGPGTGSWWLEESRERAAIWIVEVDGERLLLAWVAVRGVTQAQIREMTQMVESVRFER